MDDFRVGAAIRAIRLRRGWRQKDIAAAAGVHRSMVSRIERGHLDEHALAALRSVAGTLDIRIDIVPRWRGGELERLLNSRHSELHEQLATWFRDLPDWVAAPEVSFSIFGERGVIDILAWHPGRRALLVIELKTDIVDVNDLMGSVDRKRRLAAQIARDRGWDPATVSCWVVVAESSTNRRRVDSHAAVLRAVFPVDGRRMRHWLSQPAGAVAALSFWSGAHGAHVTRSPATIRRVRRRPDPAS